MVERVGAPAERVRDAVGPSRDGTAVLAEMSADEFPHLVATPRMARAVSVEDEFPGSPAIVLRGLRPS